MNSNEKNLVITFSLLNVIVISMILLPTAISQEQASDIIESPVESPVIGDPDTQKISNYFFGDWD